MWELYDALIGGIPADLAVEEAAVGRVWTAVRTTRGVGVAMSLGEQSRPPLGTGPLEGRPLRAVAEGVKSWNFAEASVGLAAINAWYNQQPKLFALKAAQGDTPLERDAFLTYQREITGKKVAVVGHFPFLEKRFAPLCRLSILERAPQSGDYPDTACEYLLPEQEYVFITGVTLVNKTLPRLLELSQRAKVILVGPSVPMAPELYRFGVSALEGFAVEQPQACMEFVSLGTEGPIFSCGRMVSLSA